MSLGGREASVGRIVFLTLLCLSIGAVTIGFVAVFGAQSFRKEFERMVETDLPQATGATRLNAEISGLTSQVGLLLTAKSEVALDTIRIQTGDQLDAIDRQKDRLSAFEMRQGEFAEIDDTLAELVENLDVLTTLSIRRLRANDGFRVLGAQFRDAAASDPRQSELFAWLQDIETASRLRELDRSAEQLPHLTEETDLAKKSAELIHQRRVMLEIETTIEGRLNQHTQLSARLTDASRFMSSRLISEANLRSVEIQSLIRANLYTILACFLIFATVGAFIYVYLDKHVVGRIQKLTSKMNSYEGLHAEAKPSRNELTQMEVSFLKLTDAIEERENRLIALSETATEARREAEKANKSKSTLLAAASHDLRQPVHAMGLLIGGIDRNGLTDKTRETVNQLTDLTQETVRLFNSILDLSKLETGTFTATRSPVNLRSVFERVAADFQPRSRAAGTDLRVTSPDKDVFVNADEDALYRILSNLVVNAIEHANDGLISISCDLDAEVCTVIVSDNGPGLNLNVEPKSNEGSVTDMTGYGLGLSISFALASAMQTKLTFTLPEHGGTCFALPLVLSPPQHRPNDAGVSSKTVPRSMAGLNIIFLEDNADIHETTVDGLTALGCNVTACITLQQAEQAIAIATDPFVLISDVNLGRGYAADGLITDTLQHVPQLIAVIVTTATRLAALDRWRGHTQVQIIEKPFSMGRLASLLRFVASP